ncbi:LysR family transcriptional regulator [Pseudoalteromonas luteoviolacea]|uniref:LysR family transcriptional regulator n=1 Tax=Pseudoalteromonas luteoviolacea TaxID=43657 RepID=UPI001F3A2840|nr:LysR family transcriptional regulator [Pseudoalteromonas luteoviolacea]MCF6441276.1 LysR family transcriptional regulator [Pseudoalteromonas luteoviolacea]
MENIPNIDLNLLKLFAVLYQTGSVTQTASILHMSQSACSHALTRLRTSLNDELFVREKNQMLATDFANKLAADVLPAFEAIISGLQESKPFDPSQVERLTLAATDYTAWCLKPFLSDLLSRYRNLSVQIIQLEERIPVQALKECKLDLVCGFEHQQETLESLAQLNWFEGSYVTLSCKSQALPQQLPLHLFLSKPHVLIAPWNETRGIVDQTLAQSKKSRKLVLATPHMLATPALLSGTDWLLTLPAKYAEHAANMHHLSVHQPPVNVPNYRVKLYWHKTRQKDPKLCWFIAQFCQFFELQTGSN